MVPSELEELQECIQVMRSRDRIQDKVELVGVGCHLRRVRGNAYLVSAQSFAILDFARGSGKQHHISAHGVGDFDTHVPQAAETDYSDLLAWACFPMPQRRVSSNPGAQ